MTFTRFDDWRQELLAKRDLNAPDGRALFQYRLTEDEFIELEKLLREWLGKLLIRFDLGRITQLTGFSALFVLYAAEWWRRRFDGTHWSWDPILKDLDANPDDWNQTQRSTCIKRGLEDWRLSLMQTGGLRFLGSVAVQGGLPLKLLAEARGKIGLLLSQVLKQAGGTSITQNDLLSWVESLQGTLPKSYRQAVIFTLLADVAWTVLCLKEQAGLSANTDAIARLDQQVSNWREQFPLPVDDDHARGLIEQLVRDAAKVKAERQVTSLPVERHLELEDAGTWCLRSTVRLPDSIQTSKLATLFSINPDQMPRTGELSLSAGSERLATVIRRMAGQDCYRIERKPWGFSGQTAAEEHLLQLATSDGRVWTTPAPRGEALDDGLPWIFSAGESSNRLLRQGGGNIAPLEAIIALPEGWTFSGGSGAETTMLGSLPKFARSIYRIRGSVQVSDNNSLTCRIRTGQANALEESYEWHGQRFWLNFKKPGIAFKGFPQLYRVSDSTSQKVEGNLAWSVIGASTEKATTPLVGPLQARYPATGEVKQRSRLVILPPNAALSIQAQDAKSGIIKLENWGAASARTQTEGIRLDSRLYGADLHLELSVTSAERTPETLDTEIFWPHSTIPVRLTLPFPAKGVRAFDANEKEILSGSLLAAQQLLGIRLLILSGSQNSRMSIEMRVNGSHASRIHQLRTLPDTLTTEVRLQDYATDIQHLFSTDDNPDARVHVLLRIGGSEYFRLDIARYAAKLERRGNTISLDTDGNKALTPDDIANLTALALRLEHPGDEAIQLQPCDSEGVPTGAWRFDPQSREPGCWLIYPSPNTVMPFRPTLWLVHGDGPSLSPLAQAIRISNQEERERAIDEQIESMSCNFMHNSWAEIEQLAGQVGHLPLATLDIWRRFARSANGMASLALRFSKLPSGFLSRFDQELPFIWEAVTFSAWKQAVNCLLDQCQKSYGQEAGQVVFQSHLDSRIKEISALHGALQFLLGIATAEHSSPEARRQLNMLRHVGALAPQQLFQGEDSQLMRLRRSHMENQWPSGSNQILDTARQQSEVANYLYQQTLGFADGVINLPLLLAAQVATNQTQEWFSNPQAVNILRAHIAFDPEWFEEAYNLTIARCFAAGLLYN
ncbi:MAG: STY4851/ECs_5259 family protein [Rhodocyclaceae bacterium]|nr:STY4851/ECs_5259 family protein [Rhodocyclaceae bacterium]